MGVRYKTVNIGGQRVGEGEPCYVIAESASTITEMLTSQSG
jgi:hypothetical protein